MNLFLEYFLLNTKMFNPTAKSFTPRSRLTKSDSEFIIPSKYYLVYNSSLGTISDPSKNDTYPVHPNTLPLLSYFDFIKGELHDPHLKAGTVPSARIYNPLFQKEYDFSSKSWIEKEQPDRVMTKSEPLPETSKGSELNLAYQRLHYALRDDLRSKDPLKIVTLLEIFKLQTQRSDFDYFLLLRLLEIAREENAPNSFIIKFLFDNPTIVKTYFETSGILKSARPSLVSSYWNDHNNFITATSVFIHFCVKPPQAWFDKLFTLTYPHLSSYSNSVLSRLLMEIASYGVVPEKKWLDRWLETFLFSFDAQKKIHNIIYLFTAYRFMDIVPNIDMKRILSKLLMMKFHNSLHHDIFLFQSFIKMKGYYSEDLVDTSPCFTARNESVIDLVRGYLLKVLSKIDKDIEVRENYPISELSERVDFYFELSRKFIVQIDEPYQYLLNCDTFTLEICPGARFQTQLLEHNGYEVIRINLREIINVRSKVARSYIRKSVFDVVFNRKDPAFLN